MRYPWANTLLLVLVLGEGITGVFGLVSGSSDRAIYLNLHRVAGFAILILLLWKGRIVLHALSRRWAMTQIRLLWVFGALLLGTVLVLGLTWALLGPFYISGLSGMSWHIYLGVALVPLMLYHTFKQTVRFPVRFWVQRRSALRLFGLAIVGLLLWRTTESIASLLGFSGTERRFTGSYHRGQLSGNSFPSVSWLNDDPSPVEPTRWVLRVDGRVIRPLAVPYDDIAIHRDGLQATLDCTGGWYTEVDPKIRTGG